jgi:predicted PurR-regulated permease PerM
VAQPVGATRLSLTPGSIARAVVLVAAWMVMLAVVARARGSLVLFGMGVIGAALTLPLVGYLGRWMPRWLAVLAVSLVAAGAVGLLGYRAVDEVDRQTDRVADAIDESVARIEDTPRYADLAERLELKERSDELTRTLREDVSLDASRLSELAPTLASGVSEVFIVWLFAVMMLAAGPPFVQAFVRLFPSPVTQERVRTVIAVAHRRTTRYVGLMLLRGAVMFGVTFTAASLLDLRVPTVLGLAVAFLSLYPCVGLLLGGVLFAVAGALRWPDLVGPIIVGSIVLQAADVVYVQQRIERRSVAVRSFLLIVASLIGWEVEGVRGILIATVLVIFLVAVAEQGIAIRDGNSLDPGTEGLGVAPLPGESPSQPVPPLA